MERSEAASQRQAVRSWSCEHKEVQLKTAFSGRVHICGSMGKKGKKKSKHERHAEISKALRMPGLSEAGPYEGASIPCFAFLLGVLLQGLTGLMW